MAERPLLFARAALPMLFWRVLFDVDMSLLLFPKRNSIKASASRGCDRHLFALYVVAKGTEVESRFLNTALGMKWKLSTSQLPQKQTSGLWPEWTGRDLKYFSPSGGFGPVDDEGYGVR